MAGAIKGITIEFNGDTSRLGKALQTIEKDSRGVDRALKNLNKSLKFNPGNTELLAQKQQLLKQRITQTKQKLDALRQAQAKLDDDPAVDKTSQDYMELRREIIKTESQLKGFEKEARQLSSIRLNALGNQFKKVGQSMTNVGRSMTMYVTTPIVAGLTVGAKKFAEVDKTMQLTNSTMGNSAAQAQLLSDAMKDAAANSTYGMEDAATATLNFARAGLTAEEAASALAPAMNLAAGEGGNLDTVSAGLVATINGFGDTFENASMYADVFANACNNSALSVDDLSNAMSVAAPVFHAAGYSVNDAALYMGVMANAGIDANKAANALKTGMARLVEPAKAGKEWMDKLGFSITDADGNMKDSVTVQRELHDAFAGLSKSEKIAAASAIFGKNQMSNWLALIETAPEDVQELSQSLEDQGTATKMAEAMMSGFGGSLERIKSSLDVAATSLGEALAPAIAKVGEWIQKLLDWFNQLSPAGQQIVAIIAVVVAAIGPLLMIGGMLATAIGSIMLVLPMLGAAFSALLGPIGLIIAGITALIAIGVALATHWTQIKAKAVAIWNAIKAAVIAAAQALSAGVKGRINALKAALAAIWNGIKSAASAAWTAIKTKVTSVATSIKSAVSNAFTALRSKVHAVWTAIKTAIVTPIQAARDKVQAAVSRMKSIINGASFHFPHIKLPHFSISGSFGINPPRVPHFSVSWYKEGGIFTKPTIIPANGFGEAGAEAALPLDLLWEKMALMFAQNADSIVNGLLTGMQAAAAGSGGGEVKIENYLFRNGPQLGETIVKTYDTYKSRLG